MLYQNRYRVACFASPQPRVTLTRIVVHVSLCRSPHLMTVMQAAVYYAQARTLAREEFMPVPDNNQFVATKSVSAAPVARAVAAASSDLTTPAANIVVHYHELWLKGGNRKFFLHKLRVALRRALEGLAVRRITQPSNRYVIELADSTQMDAALARLARVMGIAYLGVARTVDNPAAATGDPLGPLCTAAWEEIHGERFATFVVRAKRSDKQFPINALMIEREVGGYLFDRLHAEGRPVRVNLDNPDITCHIEITRGLALIYARRIPGAGGLPAHTAGRLMCLLSGGFDSAVAAYKMMKRGAHLSFVHFWGGGALPGESSVHIARQLAERLTPWQFTAKLYLVPFEPLQREIAAMAPGEFRTLLYRRLMLRIAERIAMRSRAKGLVTGDSLGQVASQTLQNMHAVGSVARLPLYRPLAGDDKLEIQDIARRIGTHDISAEPFQDCCPMFQSKSPALFATPEQLDEEEKKIDVCALVERGLRSLTVERFIYTQGRVERGPIKRRATA
jgi:thiamine biosynthesis protein ThiI